MAATVADPIPPASNKGHSAPTDFFLPSVFRLSGAISQWRKAELRHGRTFRKYIQHGDTANTAATAKYLGTLLDQACISAVAVVSVVPPCQTASG